MLFVLIIVTNENECAYRYAAFRETQYLMIIIQCLTTRQTNFNYAEYVCVTIVEIDE